MSRFFEGKYLTERIAIKQGEQINEKLYIPSNGDS